LYDQFEEDIMEDDLSKLREPISSDISTTSSDYDESIDENECSICFLEVEMNTLACGHKFCKECLGQYLTLMIRRDEPQSLSHTVYKIEPSDGHLSVNKYDFYGVKCPSKNCKYILEHTMLKEYVDEATLNQFAWNGLRRCLISLNQWGHCQQKGCTGRLVVDIDGALRCSICLKGVCCQCQQEPHLGYSCEDARRLKLEKQLTHDKLLEYAVKNHILCCPKCYCAIEKNGGCNHMHCTRCNTNFDWTQAPFFGTGQHWYSNPRTRTIIQELNLPVPGAINLARTTIYEIRNEDYLNMVGRRRSKGARRQGVKPINLIIN